MNEKLYRAEATLTTPSDWRRLKPVPLGASSYQQQLDQITCIVDGLQGETLALTGVFNPSSYGKVTSEAKVTEHVEADPEAVSQDLAAIAGRLAKFCAACHECLVRTH